MSRRNRSRKHKRGTSPSYHNPNKNAQNAASDGQNKMTAEGPEAQQVDAQQRAGEAGTPDQHNINEVIIARWTRRLGIYTGILAVATALLVVATGISAYFLYTTDEAAHNAIVEANRAWVAASAIGAKFIAPNLVFEMNINNVGREPATDVVLLHPLISFTPIRRTPFGGFDISWPSIDTCSASPAIDSGFVVFASPASPKVERLPVQVDSDMASHLKGVTDGSEGMLIVGCISYESYAKKRFTQYCFIERQMPDNTNRLGDCDRGAYAR